MRTISPKSPGHFCVDPFWTGDIDPSRLSPSGKGYVDGSTLIDGMTITEWIMRVYADQNYCYIGYARSDEEYEKWWYYYAPNWENVPCNSSSKFYGSGSLGIIRPSGKGTWGDIFTTPIDFSDVKVARLNDALVFKNLPQDLASLEVDRRRALILGPNAVLAIDAGSYHVQDGTATLGRTLKSSSPLLQCGEGGCCTSDPALKVIIDDDIFQLAKNDGTCSKAKFVGPDDVEEEDFHVVDVVIIDILDKIVNPIGDIEVSAADITIDDVLIGIVNPIGVEVDIIDIIIEDILLGSANALTTNLNNSIVTPAGDEITRSKPILTDGVITTSAYPNPFNPSTQLSFTLPHAATVRLSVFDLQGKEVAKLVNGTFKEAGSHQVQFDAGNLPSGVYFYRIVVGNFVATKRIQLLK